MITDLAPLSKIQLCSKLIVDPGLALGNLLQNYTLARQLTAATTMPVDVYEKDNDYIIQPYLPGV
jgi:hypothetical protein